MGEERTRQQQQQYTFDDDIELVLRPPGTVEAEVGRRCCCPSPCSDKTIINRKVLDPDYIGANKARVVDSVQDD